MIPHLTKSTSIAIVGISAQIDRPSNIVGRYFKDLGFTILPINPTLSSIFGLRAYPCISVVAKDIPIDIVCIFRKPSEVIPILEDVVSAQRAPLIWLQEGVGSLEAKAFAHAHNLPIVMNVCLMKFHKGEVRLSS